MRNILSYKDELQTWRFWFIFATSYGATKSEHFISQSIITEIVWVNTIVIRENQ
jgi:hypothetical protein